MTRPAPGTSLYQRIINDVQGRILSGEWLPDHRIPSEREFSEQYGCSRMTVNKALSQLAQAGYIERRRRAGSVVSRPHAQSAILEIHDIQTEVQALGLPYRYVLFSRKERRARNADAAHFDAGGPARLLAVTALHLAGSRPFCHEERLINLLAVPEARDEPFADQAPGAWLLRRVPWSQAEHEIRAIAASLDVARVLEIAAGTPCLVIERRTWNADHVVTFVRLTYVAGSHSVVARFGPLASLSARTGEA